MMQLRVFTPCSLTCFLGVSERRSVSSFRLIKFGSSGSWSIWKKEICRLYRRNSHILQPPSETNSDPLKRGTMLLRDIRTNPFTTLYKDPETHNLNILVVLKEFGVIIPRLSLERQKTSKAETVVNRTANHTAWEHYIKCFVLLPERSVCCPHTTLVWVMSSQK